MSDLPNIKPPKKPVAKKPVAKKRVAKKRGTITDNINIHGRDVEYKYSSQPKMYLMDNAPLTSIRVIFNNETHAFFQNRDDPVNDYFYLCLEDLKKQHLTFLGDLPEDVKYRAPHNPQGFKFRSSKKMLCCYDLHSNLIMWKDCVGKPVAMKLRVKPYDFVSKSNGKRCVGLTIKVSQVNMLRY